MPGSHARRQLLLGLAFASPWLVNLLLLIGGPLLESLYYSFTDFNIFNPPRWVGLQNYATMAHDQLFWTSVANTLYLTVIGLPLGLGLALLCALALNLDLKGQPVYRAIIYLPSIVPLVVSVFVWKWLLNAQYGYINWALGLLHVAGPSWLGDPIWTKPAVILMGFWNIGATTVIFLAALKDVPSELYEAAAVDGGGVLARFRYVTWPMISPITLFQLIMGVIVNLQIFIQPYMLVASRLNPSGGGPDNSLLTYGMYLWQNAFSFLRMGYASAMAWVLFLVTMAITLLVLRTSTRWVHYGR